MSNEIIISQKEIETSIFTVRDLQVMADRDLARMFKVETRILNQAVKRNMDRFPASFMVQLSTIEFEQWKSQIVMSNEDKMGLRRPPNVFTEQGVAMLSAILRSEIAIKVCIQIMNAFVEMRKLVLSNAALFQRMDKVELRQIETEQKFELIFKTLESKNSLPEKGIFYEGQVFDSYSFIANLIRKAQQSIVLIDNYIDDTVLTLFSKRAEKVIVTLYTKNISKQLQLDVQKHNAQYAAIQVIELVNAHDRFLIIDNKELYHIGASLKDLGKKWFAFSKMDSETIKMLEQIKNKTSKNENVLK